MRLCYLWFKLWHWRYHAGSCAVRQTCCDAIARCACGPVLLKLSQATRRKKQPLRRSRSYNCEVRRRRKLVASAPHPLQRSVSSHKHGSWGPIDMLFHQQNHAQQCRDFIYDTKGRHPGAHRVCVCCGQEMNKGACWIKSPMVSMGSLHFYAILLIYKHISRKRTPI